jgi:hypothetical protein
MFNLLSFIFGPSITPIGDVNDEKRTKDAKDEEKHGSYQA